MRLKNSWLTSEPDLSSPLKEILILILSFAAGNVDALTISVLHVFIANMTGNVVLLGLAVAGLRSEYPDLIRPVRDVLAVVFFLLGSFLVGQLTIFAGRRRRWMLLLLSIFEAALFFTSTAVLYCYPISSKETNSPSLAVICLLAFSMGSQQIWARDIGVPEVTITVLTNASAQLMADPKLFASLSKNRPRNIRTVFIIVFFLGSIIGGLMLKYVNLATALLLSSILKVIAPLFFIFTPSKTEEEDNELRGS